MFCSSLSDDARDRGEVEGAYVADSIHLSINTIVKESNSFFWSWSRSSAISNFRSGSNYVVGAAEFEERVAGGIRASSGGIFDGFPAAGWGWVVWEILAGAFGVGDGFPASLWSVIDWCWSCESCCYKSSCEECGAHIEIES